MTDATTKPNVLALVVTYERLSMLQQCVDRLRAQTYPTDILVVDNNSADGTAQWLKQQHDIIYVRQRNSGGAGGFHTGLKAGFQLGYDLIWCMDDDVAPTETCLEELVAVLGREARMSGDPVGWVCSKVTDPQGEMIQLNHPQLIDRSIVVGPASTDAIPAESCSFVSVAVTRQAVGAVGLPYRQMFIWLDDVEYTHRITLSGFRGLLAPSSIALHLRTPGTERWVQDLTKQTRWRFRHHFKNTALLMRTRSRGSRKDFAYGYAQAVWRVTADLVRGGKAKWIPFAWFWLAYGLFIPSRIDPALGSWRSHLEELV